MAPTRAAFAVWKPQRRESSGRREASIHGVGGCCQSPSCYQEGSWQGCEAGPPGKDDRATAPGEQRDQRGGDPVRHAFIATL